METLWATRMKPTTDISQSRVAIEAAVESAVVASETWLMLFNTHSGVHVGEAATADSGRPRSHAPTPT